MRLKAGIAVALLGVLCSCATTGSRSEHGEGVLRVVVAESFWGDLAAQLGGDRVDVTTLISGPDVEPHDYEPTPADARAVASADYVVFNGLGYDAWMDDLLDANPVDGRKTLDIGDFLGLHDGDNPHVWYFPNDVFAVLDRIADDYASLDSGGHEVYDTLRADVDGAFGSFRELLGFIRDGYQGTPVGATESIFAGIAAHTGLDIKTPVSFMNAIAEGIDPTARDKAEVDSQIANREIAVLVVNGQNSTPDVQRLVEAAGRAQIPTVTITETPPAGESFQEWQTRQLNVLLAMLQAVLR